MKLKSVSTISLLLALIMVFAGCNLIQVNQERDLQTVVAKVNGETITKGDFQDEYAYIVYQNQLSEAYLADEVYGQYVKDMAINNLITNKILEIKAKEYDCYNLTQEELDEIDARIEETLAYYRSIAEKTINNNTENEGKTEEELAALIEDTYNTILELYGFNEEEYRQSEINSFAKDKVLEIVTAIEPFTEDQLISEHKLRIAAQRTSYIGGASNYITDVDSGKTIYYRMGGIRQARHILIALPEEIQSQISELRQAGDDEAADTLRTEELAKIKETADMVYALANSGEDFDALIAEYGEDPGMGEDNVYTITESSTTFVAEFVEGLYSIPKLGEISLPVATDFGYHIIKYVSDEQEGEVPFEEVRATIDSEMTSTAKQNKYTEQLTAWEDELNVKIYSGRIE